MSKEPADVDERWLRHLRQKNKSTPVWACARCNERTVFYNTEKLYEHATITHAKDIPINEQELQIWRKRLEEESFEKSPPRDPKKEHASPAADQPTAISKRPYSTPGPHPPARSLSELQGLSIGGTPQDTGDTEMKDASVEAVHEAHDPPRKRAALGDGISTGSRSPRRDASSSPPRRSKARPSSAYGTSSDPDSRRPIASDLQRPRVENKQIWTEHDSPLARSAFKDSSNIASIQAAKARSQALQTKPRKQFQSSSQPAVARAPPAQAMQHTSEPEFQRNTSMQSVKDDNYDIILQPETRPISQEQLVAEVKGIYAGLVMVEAKCIEVDNKQATLAQADPGAQPKLNNEQWQALIALHRTLLHEHHDFFLASQHPSASPALRRLASKYAMPARMWRHGIHSFLELLRHRLPASLDHMLAFIYLAYSMMALLYETVPAFEDTWIECLGDLGRYRMAIEDDDIRDREVWTGVARHWYSKASDKAPTTGRLYHHLAILARPNALQQLFYYSKSLCVVIPFTSARESILTLFEPVLKADNGHGQYRLPPLDTAFVKAHGLLFTNRDMERFDPAVKEFLGLLDNQIGRVTRKFMEQGYYIAVANSVAVLGFATSNNPVMQAMSPADADTEMVDTATEANVLAVKSFELALDLSMKTLDIVLQRIGDPNVLPFIHVTLVFLRHMTAHPRAMRLLEATFPWQAMALFLNTLLAPYKTPARIESSEFPTPVKDDVRPFTEDFAMRGLLWADNYYPEKWFSNDKIDDEEKYLELASMTDERKERILWLACRIAESGPWLAYNRDSFTAARVEIDPVSRSSTMYSATTVGRSETWQTMGNVEDEEEEDGPGKTLGDPRSIPGKPQD